MKSNKDHTRCDGRKCNWKTSGQYPHNQPHIVDTVKPNETKGHKPIPSQ